MTEPELKELVSNRFGGPQKCYGHCSQQTTFEFAGGVDGLIACHVCPSRYVSRVMGYGMKVDTASFASTISKALSGRVAMSGSDVRMATRYSWDLGTGGMPGRVMQVAFWTQNYRGSKLDDPNRIALFLCSSCRSFYLQPASATRTTCEKCGAA